MSKLSQEFYKLLQVDSFIASFLSFLKSKKNSEMLEFVLHFWSLQKEFKVGQKKEQVRDDIQSIVSAYIKQGSKSELNLPFEERREIMDKFEKYMVANSELASNSLLQEILDNLSHIKDVLLLQLKEERFQEFKHSDYWKQFQMKLNEPNLETTHDYSFRWVTPVRLWSPHQVAIWLQSMEIEEYTLFEEHEVSGCILCSICRNDLIQMGVTKIGSIKRVLRLLQEITKK